MGGCDENAIVPVFFCRFVDDVRGEGVAYLIRFGWRFGSCGCCAGVREVPGGGGFCQKLVVSSRDLLR